MIRHPRSERADNMRGCTLLAAPLAMAVLGLCAQPAIAAVPNDESLLKQWGDSNTGQLVPVDEGNQKFGEPKAGTPGADDRALKAWQVTTGSRSIVIGEADTGVDFNHPDLKANVWTNPGEIGGCPAGTHGYNVLSESEKCEPMDTEPLNTGKGQVGGHGTHVAGIIGAVGDNFIGVAGMNWQTTILPVKWLHAADNDEGVAKLIAALRWFAQAAREGVNIRVVNDSPTFEGTPSTQQIKEEREAIEELAAERVLFVTAAGNKHENNDAPSGRYPCKLDLSNEICVTATNDEDQLPSWANYGPHTVDLAAPGVSIYSTLREEKYGYLSGGSMAAAQVSGAAALILSVVPSLSPEALKADILDNVDRLPSLSEAVITGGRLNVCRALPGCEPAPPPTGGPTQSPSTTTSGQASVLGTTTTATSTIVLASSTLTVKRGKAAVRLHCAGTGACAGTLTIAVKRLVRQRGRPTRTRWLTIGRARLSLGAGQTASVAVALTASGRTLLSGAHGRLGARLTISPAASGPSAAQSTAVRLLVRTSSPKRSTK